MRYHALATDYDGTLAHDGIVNANTIASLKQLRDSGRKLLLVTGRRLPELLDTFPEIGYFDLVVVENGALLYTPESKQEKVLSEAPSERFVSALRHRGVKPLDLGRVIVATWDSEKTKVLDAIATEGVECQMIFNKGALMILPSGINKASGLTAALAELGLSSHNTVGVGDAENDHAFLSMCEAAVAVANALPALKERADLVTDGARGEGVQELIDRLLEDDLKFLAPKLDRYDLLLGTKNGEEIKLPAFGSSLMVAGTSGGGKSTLTTGLMDRMQEAHYQFCAIDPEGDYQSFPGAVVLGDAKRAATVPEILAVLERPGASVVVNLLGIPLEHRPTFFLNFLPQVLQLRACTGRPHWIVIDEAHHVLPAESERTQMVIPEEFTNFILVTMEPGHVDPAVVRSVQRIVAVGENPGETIRKFGESCGQHAPVVPPEPLEKGVALMWSRKDPGHTTEFVVAPSEVQSTRHSRKYASAELTPDRSFYFRGAEGKLNLRAQNLMLFVQQMEGVDDDTWLFHLRTGEYSKWFRENIKNDDLANAAADVEKQPDVSAEQSRKRIREHIEQRFTLPA